MKPPRIDLLLSVDTLPLQKVPKINVTWQIREVCNVVEMLSSAQVTQLVREVSVDQRFHQGLKILRVLNRQAR